MKVEPGHEVVSVAPKVGITGARLVPLCKRLIGNRTQARGGRIPRVVPGVEVALLQLRLVDLHRGLEAFPYVRRAVSRCAQGPEQLKLEFRALEDKPVLRRGGMEGWSVSLAGRILRSGLLSAAPGHQDSQQSRQQ